jgi:hypothetical protein
VRREAEPAGRWLSRGADAARESSEGRALADQELATPTLDPNPSECSGQVLLKRAHNLRVRANDGPKRAERSKGIDRSGREKMGKPFRAYGLIGAAFLIVMPSLPARAGEYYYAIIFGSQSHPKQLRYTHTWATFIRVVGEGPDLNAYTVEAHTISWLPQSLDVRTWSLFPEKGVNLDLYQTLDAVYRNNESVTMWGPFVNTKSVYERSLRVRQILESGVAQYRAISTPSNLLISDCIHAVAAVDPVFGRGHYPLIRVGKPASRYIARQVMTRSVFDQYAYDNSWLIPRLGLDRYPIEVIPPQQIPKRNCLFCRIPE